MKKTKRFCWEVHPLAEKENICAGSCYRFTVLTRSQMSNIDKEEMMKEIRSTESLRRKTYCLDKIGGKTPGVANALKELLCLTEDEYLGSQEPV